MNDENGNDKGTTLGERIARIDERTRWLKETLTDLAEATEAIQAWMTAHTREHVSINEKIGKLWGKVAVIVAILGAVAGALASAVAKLVGIL